MPANNVLKEIAERDHISVKELVERTMTKCGTELKAAVELGVYPNTIRYHLRKRKARIDITATPPSVPDEAA